MNTPRTIAEYLDQLRAALRGADPAMIQDALYDAEEHLRAELAEQPGRSEQDMLAHVVGSYGAPEEVAEIYRDQEIKIQRALRPPQPPRRRTWIGRFFGVAADARTWGALFYMVLALATGIFYFVWAVTGVSLSAGLAVLIIGIPFIILFLGTVRVLSLVEGRIVETMLGVRMPRRPPYTARDTSLMKRIGMLFTDAHTWTTLFYMVLMLPLGIIYFTITITLLSVAFSFIGAPAIYLMGDINLNLVYNDTHLDNPVLIGLICLLGVVLLFATLHLVRGLGKLHGYIAKHLLVPRGE
ncbi:sensor domain-containing protein [Dyella sp.]|uniref:sensor domain-containing protein n=1 Tax=Dyella sp. TaxID=1869338 RepID=UPI002ED0458F